MKMIAMIAITPLIASKAWLSIPIPGRLKSPASAANTPTINVVREEKSLLVILFCMLWYRLIGPDSAMKPRPIIINQEASIYPSMSFPNNVKLMIPTKPSIEIIARTVTNEEEILFLGFCCLFFFGIFILLKCSL